MKINTAQFRKRYNIPRSTESLLRADGVLPFEKINRFVVYEQTITDELAAKGKLGAKALIAINNIMENDGAEEHY